MQQNKNLKRPRTLSQSDSDMLYKWHQELSECKTQVKLNGISESTNEAVVCDSSMVERSDERNFFYSFL